jgi:hypothetical protein
MSHSIDELGKEHMELVIEAVRRKKQSIWISSERIAQSSDVCIVAKFVQVIVN